MTTGRIGIYSAGLWRLRDDVARLTGLAPVRLHSFGGRDVDAVLGWGHKATAERARRAAGARAVPYIAMEDGFLRGIRAGRGERSFSYVLDRGGIYYDSGGPNDLVAAIAAGEADAGLLERAARGMELLGRRRLSKYNDAPLSLPAALGDVDGIVLVVDQSMGDAAIAGAGAAAESFRRMLAAALEEAGGAPVFVKTHPDNLRAGSGGHLAEAARRHGVRLLAEAVNPWLLFERCRAVYVVSSLLGLEALMAGLPVACFGRPFYGGWGLTDDRVAADPAAPQRPRRSLATVFANAYLRYSRYLDPYDRREVAFEEAAEMLAFVRDRFHDNAGGFVTVGFSPWKRAATRPFLDGPAGPPRNAATLAGARRLAARSGARIAVWGADAAAGADAEGALVRLEDGFLRSRGLGAAFAWPASLIVDAEGLYFNARRRSGFETLAETARFDAPLLDRARRLRWAIVAGGVTKYNVGAAPAGLDAAPAGRRILVPGQVEDDASIRFGSPCVRRNIDLLRAVRERHPDAYIVYKPHPDVEAALRPGRVPRNEAERYADRVAAGASVAPLIDWCDRLETMTSLAGFEALLRGKVVATHGAPFYAGWGLTDDRLEFPRRRRRLDLDMLVAAALILYPRYVDPLTRIACPPEQVIARLAAGAAPPPSLRRVLAGALGVAGGRLLYLLRRRYG